MYLPQMPTRSQEDVVTSLLDCNPGRHAHTAPEAADPLLDGGLMQTAMYNYTCNHEAGLV